ncbi:hypothetical protein RN001_014185 [Aquatica leii]|uniref:Uncharacterized protein n=1 Tax=Aquatica leii TaxID=1421715 RepID=A0AAN7NX60_9COLE|nr:hypothetical protein RN001_014185 [Aquatica leii]
MKTFVIWFIFSLQLSLLTARVYQHCLKKNKISADDVSKAETSPEVRNNASYKCYLQCSYETEKTMLKNGTINLNTQLQFYKAVKQKLEKCQAVKGADLYDTAYQFHNCIVEITFDLQMLKYA